MGIAEWVDCGGKRHNTGLSPISSSRRFGAALARTGNWQDVKSLLYVSLGCSDEGGGANHREKGSDTSASVATGAGNVRTINSGIQI